MKNSKSVILIAAVVIVGLIFGIAALSAVIAKRDGYSFCWGHFSFGGQAQLRNTIEIPMSDIDNLAVAYGSKNLNIFKGDSDKVIIKEYLVENRKEDFATLDISNRTATVSGTKRNLNISFGFDINERIEIYLPETGLKSVAMSAGSGNISTEALYAGTYDSLAAAAGSGNIKWKDVEVTSAAFATGSGNISIEDIAGLVDVGAGSGNIKIEGFNGSGRVEAHSGNVKVQANELTGDIHMETGSGNVKLEIPSNTAAHVNLDTGSGNIDTDFDDMLSYNKRGNQASGDIGTDPVNQITVSTGSGNIHVNEN